MTSVHVMGVWFISPDVAGLVVVILFACIVHPGLVLLFLLFLSRHNSANGRRRNVLLRSLFFKLSQVATVTQAT